MAIKLVSIVIVNYNYGRFLSDAILSVVTQRGFDKCELIIVDGGSTDESIEVIKKFEDRISWWVSEPDKGQSDAFNKGFAQAKGKFGCWLNADDVMLPGTLEAVISKIESSYDVEWISGGTIFFDREGRVVKACSGAKLTKRMNSWVDPTAIGGPSSFFSLSRLKSIGGFNVRLRYVMDCDLWNRFFLVGMRLTHINRYFWGFRLHEDSKTSHAFFGGRSDQFKKEDDIMVRRPAKFLGFINRVLALRLYKVITGCALKSFYDTLRLRGRNIKEIQ